MSRTLHDFWIFSGNSNPELAERICKFLDMDPGKAKVGSFSDGETQIEIEDNVRTKDVFIIQSTCHPVNDRLVELLLMIDAFKRASARNITAVMPYFGYARQHDKKKSRVPISARLVADMLTLAGSTRVTTLDLHANSIQGFFNIPVDNLYTSLVLLPYIRRQFTGELVIVSPHEGGVERAKAFAKGLKAGLAIVDKRNADDEIDVIGNVKGKTAIVLDGMVDTGRAMTEAADILVERGAREVHGCCAHPVLSGSAIERISASPLKSLITTDTIPLTRQGIACGKINVQSIAQLLGKAILRIFRALSVTDLFI